jgi:copper chaperone CopZ
MKVQAMVAAFFLAITSGAVACGYCVEDKIAAVYDHAALAQAQARKQTTVYFAIDGAIRDPASHLKTMVERAKGVERGSARISVESAALAVAFDPRRVSLASVQRALEQKLRPLGLGLLLLDAK